MSMKDDLATLGLDPRFNSTLTVKDVELLLAAYTRGYEKARAEQANYKLQLSKRIEEAIKAYQEGLS